MENGAKARESCKGIAAPAHSEYSSVMVTVPIKWGSYSEVVFISEGKYSISVFPSLQEKKFAN